MSKYGLWGIAPRLVRNPFHIGLCRSEAQLFASLKRLKVPKSKWPETFLKAPHVDATVRWFDPPSGGDKPIVIVCIRPGRHNRIEIDGLLIHESVHIWQWVKEHYGEDNPSIEFEAYAIQNIAQGLIAAYHER